jgi:hypothetical protein
VPLRRTFLRPALLAAAVLALLAVVALASRADRPSRLDDSANRTLPMAFWDYLLTIGLVVIVAALALALVVRVPLPSQRRREFGFTQLIAIVIVAALVTYAGTRAEWPREVNVEEGNYLVPGEGKVESTQQGTKGSERVESRSPRVEWRVVAAAGSLLLVGLAIYLVRRRRRLAGFVAPAAEALSHALDESLDDLRAERDPRRAVIAAYARMERVLEHHGLPRFRSEAPLEYLARVLRELRVRSGAVLALTELFERAKFSRHEIDSEMKAEAIGALVAVRDDLREAA